MAIALRYAARSDVGLVRQNNQDSGYAGPHLLVVADGMGGHAGGDVASSLAIGELAPLDGESHGSDALEHLSKAVLAAHRELLGRVSEEPQLAGMGTTVTALLRTGSKLALAHIGDSRAYLLRDGGLVQITKDHTFVQTLVDEGRLTPEEAEQHPQRSVLMRVLSDVVEDVEPDLSMREARVGDRYLLCSDGLSGVVSFDTLRDTLAAGQDPATTCDALVQLATRGGAPDNVTCIVADIIEAIRLGDDAPAVVGAASTGRQTHRIPPNPNGSPAERAAALTAGRPVLPELTAPPRRKRRALRRVIGALIVVLVVVAGAFAALRWVQNQYFVGDRSGAVAIFRGLPQEVGPLHFSWVDEVATDVRTKDLPQYLQVRVRQGMQADSRADAKKILATLSSQAFACQAAARELATASPSPSPTSPTPTIPSPTGPTPTGPTPPGTAGPTRSPGSALGTPRVTAGPTRSPAGQGPDQVVAGGTASATLGSAAQDVNPQATNATTAAPTGSPGTPATAQDCRELPQ